MAFVSHLFQRQHAGEPRGSPLPGLAIGTPWRLTADVALAQIEADIDGAARPNIIVFRGDLIDAGPRRRRHALVRTYRRPGVRTVLTSITRVLLLCCAGKGRFLRDWLKFASECARATD